MKTQIGYLTLSSEKLPHQEVTTVKRRANLRAVCMVALIAALVFSCEQRPLEIVLPPVEPRLVLTSLLIDGIHVEAHLSTTQQLGADTINYLAEDALILLHEDGVVVDTFFQYSRYSGLPADKSLLYRTRDTVHLTPGGVYHLTAEAPGYPTVTTETLLYNPSLRVDTAVADVEILEEPTELGPLSIKMFIHSISLSISGITNPEDIVWFQLNETGNT
ncbi:MAG: hypothetical protein R2795_23855 [Saprospiraceae bacterium]